MQEQWLLSIVCHLRSTLVKASYDELLKYERTYAGYNLSLHAELIRKSSGKVGNATFPIPSNIRYFPYVVEHVAAGKQED